MKKNIPNKMPNEKELLKARLDETIKSVVGCYQPPFKINKEQALANLKQRIADNDKVVVSIKPANTRKLYYLIAVAASLLIIIGIGFTLYLKMETHVIANRGLQHEYLLPDGTHVTINADSKISFLASKFKQNRKLSLSGEAFFNVSKGKSFIITTKNADIKVLGTSFNVFARNDSFKVSCVTGKIKVSNNNQIIIITQGESAGITYGHLIKFKEKNIETIANWRKGEFNFENTSLTTIFNEIERQYNVNFVLPEFGNKYFTGSFSNKNLVETLDIVCIPMGLTYEIGSNSKIVIHQKSN
jgi:ferric-dicitrate binding protein FerR (iron transport regulator)